MKDPNWRDKMDEPGGVTYKRDTSYPLTTKEALEWITSKVGRCVETRYDEEFLVRLRSTKDKHLKATAKGNDDIDWFHVPVVPILLTKHTWRKVK